MKPRTIVIILLVLALLAAGKIFASVPLPPISLAAEDVTTIGPFTITNVTISNWAVLILLVVVAYLATRRMRLIPTGLQNFFEAVIEYALNLVEGVAGHANGRRFFPLVATLFLFIVTANWLGLLPGFGTIGLVKFEEGAAAHEPAAGTQAESGKPANPEILYNLYHVGSLPVAVLWPGAPTTPPADGHLPEGTVASNEFIPFLRSTNTSLNTTLALALISVITIQYWGFRALGLGYGTKFFNFRQGPVGVLYGLIELISEFGRVISFSFRLFGNIFAGEVLLAVIAFLIPWLATVAFLGLEIFVGFIQAVVFAALTLVFATLAVIGHGEEHGEAHAAHPEEPERAQGPTAEPA
jgi:F-type H+-transporting ATPase subunit a